MTRVLGGIAWAMTLLIVAFVAHAEIGRAPTLVFAPGQQWSIKSASPTTAKIIVGRVEAWKDKICVHVSVVDVPIPRGAPGAGGVTLIAHMPFDQTALAASVNQLLATNVAPAPSFEGGYKHWQADQGGIFTISVETAIAFMFQSINRR